MAPLFVLSEHYRSADKSGVREYSGGRAASVSLRIFFWLRQKLRCVASRPSVDGKMLAIEPRVRCGAHIPKRNAIHLDGISFWQAAPFKITMISPVFSRVSAIFGNPFPSWRGVLLDGHCATQKDIAYSKQPSPYTLIAIVYLCSPNGISTKLLTLPSRI